MIAAPSARPQRPVPASAAAAAVALTLRLALALALGLGLAGCSDDSPTETPPLPGDATPIPSLTVVGTPRVSTNFVALLGEQRAGAEGLAISGTFSVLLLDSLSSRVFLPDVRLNGVPMRPETDPVGAPIRYTLDAGSDLPGLSLGDTLHFEVRDGGDYTPPYRLEIVPSHAFLLPDSSAVTPAQDLEIRWNGLIERFQFNMLDRVGTRLRFNLAVENYSGLDRITIPARDLDTLSTGPVTVFCGVDDSEVRVGAGTRLQSSQVTVTQRRVWILNP